MATLTAIDLKESGISPIRMFNFGSPRVGNTAFAEWASTYLTDRNRITHYKDMVPHVPMHERFTHISSKFLSFLLLWLLLLLFFLNES